MNQHEARVSDADLGIVLKGRREEACMSQTALSEAMRAKGFKWAQATVWSVEIGERPLKLSEAIATADCIGFDPAIFFGNYKDRDPYKDGIKRGLELSREALERIAP